MMDRLGDIIYLSGLTSTGKTSIVRELQARKAHLFYALSFDMFEDTIPLWAAEDEKCYAEAIVAMYSAALAFSRQGKDVLIDGLIFRMRGLERHYETLCALFDGYPLHIIDVNCPMDVLYERTLARGDRRIEQPLIQSKRVDSGIAYRLSIDTSAYTAEQCAGIILKEFDYI